MDDYEDYKETSCQGDSYYGEEEENNFFGDVNYFGDEPQFVASYNQLEHVSTGSQLWQTNRYIACGINDYIKSSDVIPDSALDGILNKIHQNLDKFKTNPEKNSDDDYDRLSYLNPKMLCIAINIGRNDDKIKKFVDSGENLDDIIKYTSYLKKIKF
jgi:hypothetical protein